MKILPLTIFLSFILTSCTNPPAEQSTAGNIEVAPSNLTGEALAIKHCGTCHAYTPPGLLPRKVWENEILPTMGHRLGIYSDGIRPDSLFEPGIGGRIVRNAGIYPREAKIADADWKKIENFYLKSAPDTIVFNPKKGKINNALKHFEYKEPEFAKRPPLSIMVKILGDNQGFAFGDGKKNISSLNFINGEYQKDYSVFLKTTPVHYKEMGDTIYLTTIGTKMYPHDTPGGAIQKIFRKTKNGPYRAAELLISNLKRPVYSEYTDLDQDGLIDIIVCEYGHLTGKLAWYKNKGGGKYAMFPLRQLPGASIVRVRDVNGDGLPDIYALMAQGDEGIFLYVNQGNGRFKESRVLSFLPLNGSQYFDLVDFNQDGKEDIIYVCGDNADFSVLLKGFHGIYIYLDKGNLNFEMSYFYHLNGAYKALAHDYDLDGDMDIAAISFFPDYYRSPEESFVYLENKGQLVFEEFSFPKATKGRWIVMDAGDMDSDGDIDIALGSFVDFYPEGDTRGLQQEWLNQGPSMVVLENTIK